MQLNTSQYPDCLVVLDTLGVRSDAVILGVAALRFDLDKANLLPQKLVLSIDPDSNTAAGRKIETSSLQWWAERPDFAEVFGRTGQTLHTALEQLFDFFGDSEMLWTTAGGYEVAMLNDAFYHYGIRHPWPYWAVSCGRTLCNLAAWVGAEQSVPTQYGETLGETALLRLRAIRVAYAALNARKVANGCA